MGKDGIARVAKGILLAMATGTLAWCSGADAISLIARNRNPDLALRADPKEPVALSIVADRYLSKLSPSASDIAQAEKFALRSLRYQALNARALRVVGFTKEASGDKAAARRLIVESNRQSRRNLGAQLWLIEDAIANNDVRSALQQYHVALTTSPSSKDILFPILLNAISDTQIVDGLVPYVRADEPWVAQFMRFALAKDSQYSRLAPLIIRAGGLPKSSLNDAAVTAVMTGLSLSGDVKKAAAVFATINGRPENLLRSAAISKESTDAQYRGIGWTLLEKGAYGAATDGKGDSIVLVAYAGRSNSGIVARKPLLLPPGSYVLKVEYGEIIASPTSSSRWTISCAGSKADGQLGAKGSPIKAGSVILNFTVPSGCETQFIDFSIVGGDAIEGAEYIVNSVEIQPAG